jgi:hypothetical protein
VHGAVAPGPSARGDRFLGTHALLYGTLVGTGCYAVAFGVALLGFHADALSWETGWVLLTFVVTIGLLVFGIPLTIGRRTRVRCRAAPQHPHRSDRGQQLLPPAGPR